MRRKNKSRRISAGIRHVVRYRDRARRRPTIAAHRDRRFVTPKRAATNRSLRARPMSD
jgi:hypothetical protein